MNQCSANEVPMECHSELLFYSGTCLYRGNWPSKTIWYEPMQCQCDAKNNPVAVIQDRKGTPFEHFPRVLSTNQRAGFLALDQWEASISSRFWAFVESQTIQCITTLPLECTLTTETTGEVLIKCQLSTSWKPMECQWSANGLPMEC